MRKLTQKLGLYEKYVTTFYSLRRTFETIASTADVGQSVIDTIQGHVPHSNDMGAIYRQRVFDDQLKKCVEHVHGWLEGSILLK